MPFFWSIFCLLTVSGPSEPARTAAFYPVEQAAPWRARHLLAEKPGKFSPENLRDKMPRKAVYPALQGSGSRLHCLAATRLRGPFQSGLGLISSTPARNNSSLTGIIQIKKVSNEKNSFFHYAKQIIMVQ